MGQAGSAKRPSSCCSASPSTSSESRQRSRCAASDQAASRAARGTGPARRAARPAAGRAPGGRCRRSPAPARAARCRPAGRPRPGAHRPQRAVAAARRAGRADHRAQLHQPADDHGGRAVVVGGQQRVTAADPVGRRARRDRPPCTARATHPARRWCPRPDAGRRTERRHGPRGVAADPAERLERVHVRGTTSRRADR